MSIFKLLYLYREIEKAYEQQQKQSYDHRLYRKFSEDQPELIIGYNSY